MTADQKFVDFIMSKGTYVPFVMQLAKFVEKHKLTSNEYGKIVTVGAETQIEAFVLSLKEAPDKKNEQSNPQRSEPTIHNKTKVMIDRMTPLEEQFAQLVAEGKIRDEWKRGLTSEHYPSDPSRPTEVILGKCKMGRDISKQEFAKNVVAAVNGVRRNADPYELAAWLRVMPVPNHVCALVALDTIWVDQLYHNSYVPIAMNIYDVKYLDVTGLKVHGYSIKTSTFFLVVCEE